MNGMKNAIMQMIHFLNCPMFNLIFYCLLFYIEKVTSYEKFSHNQCFNAIDGSIEMLKSS